MKFRRPSGGRARAIPAFDVQASPDSSGIALRALLQAMVHVDGEAMVMHVGDKPFIVTPTGPIDASTRSLTLAVLNGLLARLLPHDSQRALDDLGAVQYHLPSIPEFPHDQVTLVAARGHDDVWVEIRRLRGPESRTVPTASGTSARGALVSGSSDHDALSLPAADQFWPEQAGTPAKVESGTHVARERGHLDGLELGDMDDLLTPSTCDTNPRRTF